LQLFERDLNPIHLQFAGDFARILGNFKENAQGNEELCGGRRGYDQYHDESGWRSAGRTRGAASSVLEQIMPQRSRV
jgi:hypothetical protein